MKHPRMPRLFLFSAFLALLPQPAAQGIDRRPLDTDDNRICFGIAYGPHRDGQAPGGPDPSRDQIREDLHILAPRFDLIRMYGTGSSTEFALDVIRQDDLPLKIMLGAWIGSEPAEDPSARTANREQVAQVIELANAYPDVVWAINVGNETQVDWSAHRLPTESLIDYIREVRGATSVPVTTCDDYNFWNKPDAGAVVDEVDFIGFHAYAMWNKQTLASAMSWTRAQLEDVAARYPGIPIVHAETGWATRRHTEGIEAELVIGAPGEQEQELFYRAFTTWACDNDLIHFYFQAFDENWKGPEHPDAVEKHWGLWNEDRTPKLAIRNTPEPEPNLKTEPKTEPASDASESAED